MNRGIADFNCSINQSVVTAHVVQMYASRLKLRSNPPEFEDVSHFASFYACQNLPKQNLSDSYYLYGFPRWTCNSLTNSGRH